MKINYNNKRFKVISNSCNSEVSSDLIFTYKQVNNILTCSYSGDNILHGHLLGLVNDFGGIKMSYHQINTKGILMTGTCSSTPELTFNNKIRLYESWQWSTGDLSKGSSILEEI